MKVLPADVSQYPFKVPDLDPPVSVTRPFPPAFCNKYRGEMLEAQAANSGVYGENFSHNTDTSVRSSSFCYLSDKSIAEVGARLTAEVWKLTVATSPRWRRVEISEPIQFLKYDEANNGHFRSHSDSAYFDSGGVFQYTSPHRVFTSIIYLNDDFEGGELVLASVVDDAGQPIVIKPQAGMLIVFPSDVRFMHEVRPVIKGVRCAVVGWFNAFEQVTSYKPTRGAL